MKKLICLLFLFAVGCGGSPKKPCCSLDCIQGSWKVIEATDPNGKGYDSTLTVDIKGNTAFCKGGTLDLSFKDEHLQLKSGEKVVGETKVYLSEDLDPPQMLWQEKGSKQKTLFVKE